MNNLKELIIKLIILCGLIIIIFTGVLSFTLYTVKNHIKQNDKEISIHNDFIIARFSEYYYMGITVKEKYEMDTQIHNIELKKCLDKKIILNKKLDIYIFLYDNILPYLNGFLVLIIIGLIIFFLLMESKIIEIKF